MNIEEKFSTKVNNDFEYKRPVVEIEDLGKGVFHGWVSKDTLTFIGKREEEPVMIEINKNNIIENNEHQQDHIAKLRHGFKERRDQLAQLWYDADQAQNAENSYQAAYNGHISIIHWHKAYDHDG